LARLREEYTRKIRVLLAEDHAIVRQGIRLLFESRDDVEVVGEASDGREAIRKTGELRPDLVLMDISMPGLNGLVSLSEIARQFPRIKVLVLTMHEDMETVRHVMKAGAVGYVLKKSWASDLFAAIEAVRHGEVFLSPAISEMTVENYDTVNDESETTLSLREKEILQLVAEGHPNREIADALCISVKTVGCHKENIKRKLCAKGQAELIKYAISKGVIELPKI